MKSLEQHEFGQLLLFSDLRKMRFQQVLDLVAKGKTYVSQFIQEAHANSDAVLEHREQEIVLILEVIVDCAHGHSGFLGNGLHAGVVKSLA